MNRFTETIEVSAEASGHIKIWPGVLQTARKYLIVVRHPDGELYIFGQDDPINVDDDGVVRELPVKTLDDLDMECFIEQSVAIDVASLFEYEPS